MSNRKKLGALVDRNTDEAARTARRAARTLGGATFGSVALSMVGGYVDTAGFILLFGLFTAHVTGDLITAAATMVQRQDLGAGARLAMIPVFIVTVMLITLFTRAIRRRGAATLAPLLGLMTLALGLFGAAGYFFQPQLRHAGALAVGIIGGLGVAAMGIQNALMKGALRSFAQTTLMTGNLTQFTIDLTDFIFPPAPADDPRQRARLRHEAGRHVRTSGLPLVAFITGAGLGAFATKYYGFLCIAAPTAVVAVLSIIAAFRSRK
ncbi:MAG: YoaK family protein [Spirochaetia bacterium]